MQYNCFESRLSQNRRMYKEYITEYPIVVETPKFSKSRLSPVKLQQVYPDIQFVELPFDDLMHWMFKTVYDSNKFTEWSRSITKIDTTE